MKKLYKFIEGSVVLLSDHLKEELSTIHGRLTDLGYPISCSLDEAMQTGMFYNGENWMADGSKFQPKRRYRIIEITSIIQRFSGYDFNESGQWVPITPMAIANVSFDDWENVWMPFLHANGYPTKMPIVKPHRDNKTSLIWLDSAFAFTLTDWDTKHLSIIDQDEFRGLIDGSNHVPIRPQFHDEKLTNLIDDSFHKSQGIINKYRIEKTDGSPMPDGGEYFVLRLDDHANDKRHMEACRKAIIKYATEIQDHLPALSADIIKRYGMESDANEFWDRHKKLIELSNGIIKKYSGLDNAFNKNHKKQVESKATQTLPTYWLVQATTENVISELWDSIKWSVFASYPHMMESPILTDHYIGIDNGNPIVMAPESSELKRFTIISPKEWHELVSMPVTEPIKSTETITSMKMQLMKAELRKKQIDIDIAQRRLDREIATCNRNIPDEKTLVVKTVGGKSVVIDGHTIKGIFRYFEQDHKSG